MGSNPFFTRDGFTRLTHSLQIGSRTPFTRIDGTLCGLYENIRLHPAHCDIAM